MKYIVCARYCGAILGLEEFDTIEEAKEFCKKPFYDDVLFDNPEDCIPSDEMWIEEKSQFVGD